MTVLPAKYRQQAALDLSKNRIAALGAIVFGIMLLVAVGRFFVQFTNLLRPAALEGSGLRDIVTVAPDGAISGAIPPQLAVGIVVALALVMVIHEPMHGPCYWHFSGKRPTLGITWLGIYVGAPSEVYFPRNQYLVVGIAPLVLSTLVGLLLVPIAPVVLVPMLILFVAFNSAGAAGDLIMVARLLFYSPDTLMQDIGTSVIVYGRGT
ncbi:MAG: hypothetical protein GTO63_22130 [Anaerolineae bacterium]|nr:hypothetical protein [Anaerolineae bacterium]NIN97479.1 hypothetical protein [Anaerolineae bacterium]NIQ80408.1 hypothetical protein [Anaerolineae bacterium]